MHRFCHYIILNNSIEKNLHKICHGDLQYHQITCFQVYRWFSVSALLCAVSDIQNTDENKSAFFTSCDIVPATINFIWEHCTQNCLSKDDIILYHKANYTSILHSLASFRLIFSLCTLVCLAFILSTILHVSTRTKNLILKYKTRSLVNIQQQQQQRK